MTEEQADLLSPIDELELVEHLLADTTTSGVRWRDFVSSPASRWHSERRALHRHT